MSKPFFEHVKPLRGHLVMVTAIRSNIQWTDEGYQESCVGYLQEIDEGGLIITHIDDGSSAKRMSVFQTHMVVSVHQVEDLKKLAARAEQKESPE